MAIGDAAAAAGLPVVASTKDKRLGYQDINALADKVAVHMTDGKHGFDKITGQASTAQIANSAVTNPKIANDAVTDAKIQALQVKTRAIADGNVTAAKIADETITGAKMADRVAKDEDFHLGGSPLVLETAVNPLNHFIEIGGGIDAYTIANLDLRSEGVTTILGGLASLKVGDHSGQDRVSSESIRSNTTSSSANVYIDPTTGILVRSTSSRRYKRDVEDAPDLPNLLKVRPRLWRDKNQAEDDDRTFFGVVAEELDDLGLKHLVSYVGGQPEAVAYDRIGVALIPIVRRQAVLIANLLSRVEALENSSNLTTPEVPETETPEEI